MANDLGNPLGFFFGGDTTDPRVNQQLRQKIALAMMARESKYPKNLGEGLSAIGDAIAQRHMMQSLLQGDLAQQDQARAVMSGSTATAPQAITEPDATPPAVAAINRAITPSANIAPATPQQPLETPLTGDEQKANVSSGDYNVLDAQANLGFKPTPGYMQDAIAAKEPNPDMQAYYGSLSGSEAKNAQDVSPTGAAGPFQFTRGTAAQYGIPGAARQDPNASTDAVRKLTADNAATFAQINGRPPTFQELALMHQQGGATGARMAAGTGNAPPGNLAVNNIPSGASPAQAVGKINSFYGMPNAPAPVNQRDAIAGQLMQQPAPSPTGDQRLALATPDGVTGLQPAPPLPPQVRAPPVQVAQNAPQPRFDYVMPKPAPVPPLQPTPVSPAEQRAQAMKLKFPNNPYIGQQTDAIIAEESQKRAIADKAANEEYTAKQAQQRELELKYQEQVATQAKRGVEGQKEQEALTKSQQENRLRAQFGNMPPDEVFKQVDASKTVAKSAVQALEASQNARKALDGGAILGSGANQRLDVAKFFTGMGLVDKGDKIANTEVFKAAMQPIVASILHQTSGTSQLSDNELAFAKSAAAGNITLDPQSIRRLMDIIDKRSNEVLKDHQTLTGALFGDNNPQAKALYGVEAPLKSQDDQAREWLQNNPNDPRAPAIRQKLGIR